MKVPLLALAALLLVPALVVDASAGTPPGLSWRGWDRGLTEARAAGKPVLVDVYTDWCGWCRRMDADVYARPEIRDYLSRKFVTVKIDAEATDAAHYDGRVFTSRSLAARLGVSSYPTTLFLRPAGDRPVSVPGYLDAEHFMIVLRYVAEGHMDAGVPFQEFVKRFPAPAAGR